MLYLSVRTVETHRAHIMQKLRLRRGRSSCGTRSIRACWTSPRNSVAARAAFPQSDGGGHRGRSARRSMIPRMSSYAVTWKQGDEDSRSGRLKLSPGGLAFEGCGGDRCRPGSVFIGDLREVRVGRSAADRISGRQTLVLERRTGDPIRIASIVHPGIISELAEHLASRFGEGELHESRSHYGSIAGRRERAGGGVTSPGPPFDPGEIGLERHHVFLTLREAVFLFEADSVPPPSSWERELLVRGLGLEGPRRRAAAARRGRLLLAKVARAQRRLVRATPGPATATAATSSRFPSRLSQWTRWTSRRPGAGWRRRGADTRSSTSRPGSRSASTSSSRRSPTASSRMSTTRCTSCSGDAAPSGRDEPVEVSDGRAAFVPAGADHKFMGYEGLSTLVVFSRPHDAALVGHQVLTRRPSGGTSHANARVDRDASARPPRSPG